MQITYGSTGYFLAKEISKNQNLELLEAVAEKYDDGECKVRIDGTIGKDITIVQSTSHPVNDNLMELLLLADTAKRAGAKNIRVLIPYFGYSRQDRCAHKNGPISASLVIKMIEVAGITEVITFDLHSENLEGVFNIQLQNISTASVFLPVLEKVEDKENCVIVSPDLGGAERAENYASMLGTEVAIIKKYRDAKDQCHMQEIMGEVEGKNCIIIDDIIDGGSTMCKATDLLTSRGAKSVIGIATHGVFSGSALQKISDSPLQKLYISNSIKQLKILPEKISVLKLDEFAGLLIK